MSIISKPFTFTAGATIIASQHNADFDTLYNDYNGNIDNSNIVAAAAIVDTKLNTIATAGKVDGTALTDFAGIASSAGYVPVANMPHPIPTNVGGMNANMSTAGQGMIPYFISAGSMGVALSGTSGQVIMSSANSGVPTYITPIWAKITTYADIRTDGPVALNGTILSGTKTIVSGDAVYISSTGQLSNSDGATANKITIAMTADSVTYATYVATLAVATSGSYSLSSIVTGLGAGSKTFTVTGTRTVAGLAYNANMSILEFSQ